MLLLSVVICYFIFIKLNFMFVFVYLLSHCDKTGCYVIAFTCAISLWLTLLLLAYCRMYVAMVCLNYSFTRLLFLLVKCNLGYQLCLGYKPFLTKKRKKRNLLERNWLKEKKTKSQHAFERKWPPVSFGKLTGQDIERFLKKNVCAWRVNAMKDFSRRPKWTRMCA